MSEVSYKNWNSMSDKALMAHIGKYIKHYRVEQNLTQATLAKNAGMSRSTLSLLERGEPVTLLTLIQALRILNKLSIIDIFTIHEVISPMMVAEMELKKRKRANNKNNKNNDYLSEW